jgi:hypothetical protein
MRNSFGTIPTSWRASGKQRLHFQKSSQPQKQNTDIYVINLGIEEGARSKEGIAEEQHGERVQMPAEGRGALRLQWLSTAHGDVVRQGKRSS